MRHARNKFDFFIFVTSARELCAGAVLTEHSNVKPVCVLCVYICGCVSRVCMWVNCDWKCPVRVNGCVSLCVSLATYWGPVPGVLLLSSVYSGIDCRCLFSMFTSPWCGSDCAYGCSSTYDIITQHSQSAQGIVTIYPLLLLLFGSFDGGSGQREREEGSEGKRKRVDRRDGEGAGVINRCVQEVSSSELAGCRGLLWVGAHWSALAVLSLFV